VESERSQHRCASCGSRLGQGARACTICGTPVPFRVTRVGSAIESAIIVGLIVMVATGLLWLRRGDGARVVTGPSGTPVVIVGAAPTNVATLTPGLPASATRPVNTPNPPTATPLPETVTHVVASGDTLYGIAEVYGVTPDVIIEVNGLARPDALSIGQQLLIPVAPTGREVSGDGTTAVAPSQPATATERSVIPGGVLSQVGPGTAPAPDPGGEAEYPAPWVLGPSDRMVSSDTVLLRWASVGVLPPGAYYVVSIRDPEQAADKGERVWVTSNATQVRLPSGFRPALGTSRQIEWSVAVLRRGERLIGSATDVQLSDTAPWQSFIWAPGRLAQATP
jgi:LysM repeat protein